MFKDAVLILIGFCFISSSHADDATVGTGNELIKYCNQQNYQASNDAWLWCMGYVNGVKGGYAASLALIRPETAGKPTARGDFQSQLYADMRNMFCTPDTATRMQIALVVSKYLADHPEKLNEGQATLVIDAFFKAWPCFPKN